MWCTFDSAISTPLPVARIEATPFAIKGMMAGDKPSNGSSSSSNFGSSANARAIDTILRALPGRQFGQVGALEGDVARHGVAIAHDAAKCRGLSGAVAPHEADQF